MKLCQFCNEQIVGYHKWVERAKFCSKKCADSARSRKQEITCLVCGIAFKVKRNRKNPNFCSMACVSTSKKGKQPPYMNDQKTKEAAIKKMSATKMVYSEENPATNSNGYLGTFVKKKFTHIHRVLVSRLLGRPLVDRETVHHIDEDRKNNDVSNLYLFRHRMAHRRWHAFLKRHSLDPKILTSNLT